MKIYLNGIVIILMILFCSSSQGVTFNVSTTQELRQSLLDAAQNGQSDTIILADGTYATTDDGGGTFVFLDNEDCDLTLQGSSAENVILSGDNTHQVLDFRVVIFEVLISLESLSIENGYSIVNGGGFYTTENLFIQNSNISNNTTNTGDGGGFYVAGSANISNSIISSNIASNSYSGGGFYVGGSANISNSTISNNIISNSYGSGQGGGFNVVTELTCPQSLYQLLS